MNVRVWVDALSQRPDGKNKASIMIQGLTKPCKALIGP